MTYEYTAEDIAAIRERADFKWESAGVECFAALYRDGERPDWNHADAELVEGDRATHVVLSRLSDAPEPSASALVTDRLTIDANVYPFATVWWIDGVAYVAEELVGAPTRDAQPDVAPAGTTPLDPDIDPDGLMLVHDACGELLDYCKCIDPYDAERYASARATVLAELRKHEDAFEPDDSEATILGAGRDCYGDGFDMIPHGDDDPYPAIYRYWAHHYPAGEDADDDGLEADEWVIATPAEVVEKLWNETGGIPGMRPNIASLLQTWMVAAIEADRAQRG